MLDRAYHIAKMRGCALSDVFNYDTQENTALYALSIRQDVVTHLKVVQGLLLHIISKDLDKKAVPNFESFVKDNIWLSEAFDIVHQKKRTKPMTKKEKAMSMLKDI